MNRLQSLSYKTLFTILFLSLAGIVFFLRIGKPAQKVSASWWDDSWHYRKAISISNPSGSNLTDFQVSVSIGTSQLIADGKMQADCDDIRITDINGSLLPHWIEENNPGCNQLTDTKVWLKANLLPTSGAAIYLYYGNQQASNTENGDNVFEFFDDFNSDLLNTTIWTPTGGYSLSNGELTITTGAIYTKTSILTNPQNYMYEYRPKWSSTVSSYAGLNIGETSYVSGSNSGAHELVLYMCNSSALTIPAFAANGTTSSYNIVNNITQYTASSNVYYVNSFSIDSTNIKFYNNYSQTNSYSGTLYSPPYLWLGYFTGSNASTTNIRDITIDWVKVRKYTSSDPTPSLQPEEVGGLIAHWKLDEGSGNTIFDSSTNEIGVTFGGGSLSPTWLTGQDVCISNSCLSFNGTTNRINLPTINNIKAVSFWLYIKSGQINSRYIIDARTGLASGYIYSGGFGTWAKMYINGVNTTKSWSNIPQDQWIHVYLEATSAFTDDINFMSRYSNNEYLSGKLDEIKLYLYSRTEDQIQQDYLANRPQKSTINLGVKSNTGPNLKSSLIAYYKFDEGNGNYVNNSINNGIGATATFGPGTSTPSWSNESKSNKSLNFEAGYIKYPNYNIPANGEISFVFWANANNTTNPQLLISKYDTYNIGISSGYISGRIYEGTVITTSIWSSSACAVRSLLSNGWHHIAFTAGGGFLKLFIDGIEKSSDTWNGATYQSPWDNRIGAGSVHGVNPFNGYLDEVKIYNRALTLEEIKQDYNANSTIQFGSTSQNIGGTTTSLEYCIPGDTSYCAPPVAQWNFEENTGTTTKDTSGNNNNGTFGTGNSAPTWNLGANNKGTGISLINENQYITTTNGSNQNFSSAITISAWIKKNSAGNNYDWIINKGTSSTDFGLTFSNGSTTQLRAFKNSGATFADSNTFPSIADNKWHYTTVTFDSPSSSIQFYIDGKSIGVASTSSFNFSPINTNSNNYSIGSWWSSGSPTHYFKGYLDDIKVYNYARTPAQIAYDYNRGAPIGWWKLDECQGNIAYNSASIDNTSAISIGQSGSQDSLGTCAVGISAAWTNGASGKINSSLNFDGTDDYITKNSSINTGNNFSVFAWVKPKTSISGRNIVVLNSYPYLTDRGWLLSFQTDNSFFISMGKDNAWAQSSSGTITNNIWNFIGATVNNGGETIKLYFNGLQINTALGVQSARNISYTDNFFYIGKRNSEYFNGQIDDVRIYNYALTSEQVKQVYNGGAVNFN